MALSIVILGPAHPFRGGGITTFNERLARGLQESGHQVEIVNFTVQYPSFLFPGKTQISQETAPKDLRISRRLHSMNPVSWYQTGRYIRKKKPDLVIVRYWLPFMGPAFGTVLRQAKKNRHTRVIAITDNVRPHEKRIGDEAFTRYFVKPCDGFITMSARVEQDLNDFVSAKPVLRLRHPLYDNFGEILPKSEARKTLGLDPDKKWVLFFGFIRAYKGLDILLNAISRVHDPAIQFLVAGEFYEEERPYRELIRSLKIEDRVKIVADFIPNDAVKQYFSAADLVVQPYRNATQSGVTPLAYHFEIPMVVTRVGGLPDYVEDGKTGLIAEPEPVSLADAITRYFEFGEEHFRPHIRQKKQELSWQVFISQIEGLFERLND
jgi:glycosyltransferase involved in cell wall biosynthesis